MMSLPAKILDLMLEKEKATLTYIASEFNISRDTAMDIVDLLMMFGFLRYEGRFILINEEVKALLKDHMVCDLYEN